MIRRLALAAVAALAACSASAADPCDGLSGTCLSLTITSSRASSVDTLELTASGAATGMHSTTNPTPFAFPVHVAVRLSAGSGALHLNVVGKLAGALVASGALDTTLSAGQHLSATVDIEPNGGSDGGLDGGSDGSPDLAPVVCDPKGTSGPACVWRWQTPLPQGEEINGVYAFSDSDIFAITKATTVLHRDATGWGLLAARPTAAFGLFTLPRTLAGAANSGDLYTVGMSSAPGGPPAIFHSTDKGATWIEEALPSFGNPAPYFFGIATGSNGQHTLAVSDSGDIMTRDATGKWTTQNFTFGAGPGFTHFQAVDVGVVVSVAVGSGGLIAHANTGTSSWTKVLPSPPVNIFQGVCSGGISSFRYWAVGSGGGIYSSTDGAAWSAQTSNTSSILMGCVAVDDKTAWAYGQNGTVVHTTNGGASWSAQVTGVSDFLLAGSHSPGATLTVVGQDGTLLRSVDGSNTFTNERTGPNDNWVALYGFAPKTVYAAGSKGAIARTVDGSTWQTLTTPTTPATVLTALWGSSASDLYAVGTAGTVLHSTDGTTFTRYANPSSGGIPASETLLGVSGFGPNHVFTVGTAAFYHSTDGGTTWAPLVVTGMAGLPSAVFAMGGQLWVGGSGGQIYTSADGSSFIPRPIPGPVGNLDTVGRIRGRMPNDIFVIYQSAPIASHSPNGGMTWTSVMPMNNELGNGSGVYDITVTPTGNYVYVSSSAGLAVSQDEGANWVRVQTGISENYIGGLFAFSDSDVYATTNSGAGGILHYGN